MYRLFDADQSAVKHFRNSDGGVGRPRNMLFGTVSLQDPDANQKVVAPFSTFVADSPYVEEVAGDNGCGGVHFRRVVYNAADDFRTSHFPAGAEDPVDDCVPNFAEFFRGGENPLGTRYQTWYDQHR
jgi:hypothetical protein